MKKRNYKQVKEITPSNTGIVGISLTSVKKGDKEYFNLTGRHYEYTPKKKGVPLNERRGRKVESKNFSIKKYGGIEEALDAVIAWRDEKKGIKTTKKEREDAIQKILSLVDTKR
jgi:hypothetical protein